MEKVTKQYEHYFGKKYTHVSRCTEKYLKVYALKYSVVISGWNGMFLIFCVYVFSSFFLNARVLVL